MEACVGLNESETRETVVVGAKRNEREMEGIEEIGQGYMESFEERYGNGGIDCVEEVVESCGESEHEVSATRRFRKEFLEQEYGHVCGVSDRLWFKNDLRDGQQCHVTVLESMGITRDGIKVCSTCAAFLEKRKIPTLAVYNGFQYPPKPGNLPELNATTTRLISPRIPFMQIRRLRMESGTYQIVG